MEELDASDAIRIGRLDPNSPRITAVVWPLMWPWLTPMTAKRNLLFSQWDFTA